MQGRIGSARSGNSIPRHLQRARFFDGGSNAKDTRSYSRGQPDGLDRLNAVIFRCPQQRRPHSQSAQHSQVHELLPEMVCDPGFDDGGPVPTRGNCYHVLPYGEVLRDEGQADRECLWSHRE